MGEESSVVFEGFSYNPLKHLQITELEIVKEESRKTKEKLEKEKTIRNYESLLPKYPPKEEKKEFKKTENVLPYELWKGGFTDYGADEEEIENLKLVERKNREIFEVYPWLALQPTTEPKKENFERALQSLEDKLEAEGELSKKDIIQLIEIDSFAEKHDLSGLSEKVAKIIVNLERRMPAEDVELKEGEIKEFDEDTLVRKRKDGVIELIIL